MADPVFINRDVILAIHEEQLAQHGGGTGLRDEGLLESALNRPINRAAYDAGADFASLATDYAFGIAKNHPFVDGNKRTAFVAMELFLNLNGLRLQTSDAEAVLMMLQLAGGESGEDDFAAWIRGNALPA